ncbi:hypothetical protein BAUCODRAFT_132943 [Baudoinia panamericana UAMH 10762]|uniref:Amino acid permease/ SLC12A domain-containing protein n=1 Tax=Baudoinia panamericana (strain UAMH 10762) TaxID=717646 RepID=M2LIQ7_BAUPA|nr:uncharacterized protein BAUCODRAFT_132943 [Baudoinia panamericana UAMH 10762]EMC94062.1 hypothetical protein BAUCODRAFT_132943 [Baudoinia panamericana UAMH 10762]
MATYHGDDAEKQAYEYQQHGDDSPTRDVTKLSDPYDQHHSLHRGLSARHVSMIAIGGAIGTGLIIGTGSALATGGPAAILISYCIVGCLVYMVMTALGEMATWLPGAGGFYPYATRFVDPAFGFALGWTYLFKYWITTPNQLTAAALVIQYWCPPERVNPGVFIAVFLVVIILINYLGVRVFGELEFWLSSIKIAVILGIIILCIVLAAGGGPNHEVLGFRYWHNPGAFHNYIDKGSLGRFLAVWSSMVTAVFAFLGTELVGVTVGEAQNPRRNVPRAIKLTFWRILIFYICSVFLLGMIVPYNSSQLIFATKKSSSAAASPFVVAIRLAGIHGLPGFLNACILIFVFSAANSDLYIGSRTLHGLALKKQAPAFLAITDKRGVPYYALGVCATVCCLAFLNVSTSSKQVFTYFVNVVSILGLLSWISILVSHIYFVRARRAQGITDKMMPYKSPFGLWGSIVALVFCCIIALTKNFTVFVRGRWDYKTFITGYIGIPVYLLLILGYKVIKRTHAIKPHEADLFTGKDIIDADEQEWLAKAADRKANGGRAAWWYDHTIGFIF